MTVADRKVAARRLTDARRVVVKVGSTLLVDSDKGRLNRSWLESLAADVATFRKRGQEIILVSSGAIALGRRHLNLSPGKLKLEESQAAAAVGQIRLAHAYKELLDAHEIAVAQILLTLGDTEQRRRYLNARGTLNTLLGLGAVPVINENDTVATAEIRYGDNDRLAARVAQMIGADCLVLALGCRWPVHRGPERGPRCAFYRAGAGNYARHRGNGRRLEQRHGYRRHAHQNCRSQDCRGRRLSPVHFFGIRRASAAAHRGGSPLHLVCAHLDAVATRKQWIAGTLKPAGAIAVDDGAVRALMGGKSLLPAGVTRALGRFDRGDTVSIIGPDGTEIGRGICAYSDIDAARIIGRKSADIEKVLGFRGRDEIVHRDDLVLLRIL